MPANSTVTGWLIRLGPLILVAALAALWEAASRSGLADPRLLPPLSEVLRVLAGLLQDARFRGDLGFTLSEIAVAFAIVGPLGLAVGFFLGESLAAYRMFAPALHLLLSIPKSIFLPVFIFAFGIGFLQKVIFAVTLAFFIVVLSGIAAAVRCRRAGHGGALLRRQPAQSICGSICRRWSL